MNDKLFSWLLKGVLVLFAAAILGSLWYYPMGRKPRVLVSVPVNAKDQSAVVARSIGHDEVLLIVGSKVSLYDLRTKASRWSANLTAAAPAATPAPKATPKPAAKPVAQEKPDPLIAARVKKRFAKLEKWAADLTAKRGALKSALQIEAFNEEAAKYHAELIAARAEAGIVAPAEAPPHTEDAEETFDRFAYAAPRVQMAVIGSTLWLAQGRSVTGFDRADGHVVKCLALPGHVTALETGADELFVIASVGAGRTAQVTRIAAAGATVQNLSVEMPPEPPEPRWVEGAPQVPAVATDRVLFSAHRSPLLRLDAHLVEKKLIERQVMSGESGSDLEEWDKKSKGGFGDDALAMAKALEREGQRDATGGREITDESTYRLSLTRPFAPATAAATVEVHGPARVFSTATLDLVAAGKELVAFDRSNKKLWQAQLAQPLAPISRFEGFGDDEEASPAQPCLETADRLYFFDGGYLTAFAKATGQPAWRLPLQHIARVQLADTGHLYVSTAPSGIGTVPQHFCVEAKSGKVTWKIEKYDACYVSGSDLYATRETRNAEDMVNAVFDRSKAPQCRWKLYKLSTRNGEPQWEWFQTRRPTRVEADHKRVALLFADELQVLTSIAL